MDKSKVTFNESDECNAIVSAKGSLIYYPLSLPPYEEIIETILLGYCPTCGLNIVRRGASYIPLSLHIRVCKQSIIRLSQLRGHAPLIYVEGTDVPPPSYFETDISRVFHVRIADIDATHHHVLTQAIFVHLAAYNQFSLPRIADIIVTYMSTQLSLTSPQSDLVTNLVKEGVPLTIARKLNALRKRVRANRGQK